MITELDNINVIKIQWESLRKKLLTGRIKYDDIERLKKEPFFDRFHNMFKDYNKLATTELSKIDLMLRSVYGKDHSRKRFYPLKKGTEEWEKHKKHLECNRFNRPDRAFIYFGISMNDSNETYETVRKTCYEELRVPQQTDNLYMSTLEFKVRDSSKKNRVLDFSKIKGYESCDDIIKEMEIYVGKLKYIYFTYFFRNDFLKYKLLLISEIKLPKININEYIINIYLKLIDNIFIQVNTEGLSKREKDKIKEYEYAPFNAFANYIEEMGYSGIIYNSTVCDGLNLVLFEDNNVKDIENIKIEEITN